jgi:predicted SnoaL-like aldol condensation-catalyzing enzyme
MKKMQFLFTIGLLLGLLSCNDTKTEKKADDTMVSEKKGNSMAEKNLAAMHIVNKAFETGDPGSIDEAVAGDFIDHTDQGDKNRDSLKAMITMMHKGMPDMKVEILKEMADDEYVFSLNRYTGIGDGKMGMPKGPYDMKAIEVVRCKEGKGVEHWAYMQPGDVMKMMQQMEGKK